MLSISAHDEAETIAAEHVRWMRRRHEGHQHVRSALPANLRSIRLADALAIAWLSLPNSSPAFRGADAQTAKADTLAASPCAGEEPR